MDDYAKYEQECATIRKENAQLLQKFAAWLRQSKLAENTIKKHVENCDFYVNEFLLYEDAVQAKDGTHHISMFLGYWFIKKAMWASPAHIKSNAASLKKFYTFLSEQGLIPQQALHDLKETIKADMPEWIATVKRYDDETITDMKEVWGF